MADTPDSNTDAGGQAAGFYANPECRRSVAHFLAERTIAIFPCWWVVAGRAVCACPNHDRCPSPGKHPIEAGWQALSTTDPDTIRAWFIKYPHMNVGVDLEKSRLMVLDVDKRVDGDGFDTLHALEQKLGHPLPRTWVVRTGSGGLHIWLWVPEGEYPVLVKSLDALGLGPHVDIQAGGKLVIAPGSSNQHGQYQFLGGEDGVDPLDPDEADDDRIGPERAPADLIALLTRNTTITLPAQIGPVHTTVLAHLAARSGLIRPCGLIRGNLAIRCPYSRPFFPGGHDEGADDSCVIMGASPGHRIGGLACMHATCQGSGKRWLADVWNDRERFPDGRQWLADINVALDDAGIEPLSPHAQRQHGSTNGGPPRDDDPLAGSIPWLVSQGVRFIPPPQGQPHASDRLVSSAANLMLFLQVHPAFRAALARNMMKMQIVPRRELPAFHPDL